MIAVIFEVMPAAERKDEYFSVAEKLQPELKKIGGFISIERFESFSQPGKILSLSFWKDEESVAQWRNVEMHRQAQAQGRTSVFSDYRLRVAHVMRDYGMKDRAQAPADSKYFHDNQE